MLSRRHRGPGSLATDRRVRWQTALFILGNVLAISLALIILFVAVPQEESVASEALDLPPYFSRSFPASPVTDRPPSTTESASVSTSSLVSSSTTSSSPSPIPTLSPKLRVRPVISSTNWPDPSIVLGPDDTWYSFTTSNGTYHAGYAYSKNFLNWTLATEDALPMVGQWVTSADNPRVGTHRVWACDVIQLPNNGNYVLYYSAISKENTGRHCIGAATSSSITGPYVARNESLACPLEQGGAIDPSGFIDDDTGRMFVVYKVDGNAMALRNKRGALSTPIMLQEVSIANGYERIGAPIQIFDRQNSDGHLVEGPCLRKFPQSNMYTLLLSSGNFAAPDYKTTYAVSNSITGPYTRPFPDLLHSGSYIGLTGPGGASFTTDGRMVFHGIIDTSPLLRGMYTSRFNVSTTGEITLTRLYNSQL